MLNGWAILIGVLCVLFTPSISLSQVEPSQSEILNAVHKVDKEVAVLSENPIMLKPTATEVLRKHT